MEKTINVKTSRPVLRHKMYKSGKKWIVAGIAGAAAMTYSMTIHADTTSQQTTANSTNTQDINAGGNAVTNTSAQANSKTETTFNVSSASSPSQISSNALTESKVSSSQQGTIYTPVNVDHSKLDNAVNQASSAGVHVIHDTDTTQNTTNANLNSDRQKIEDQYNDQIADLQAKTRKAQHATENYNTYNNYQGDHTALDQAANNAKSVPGLSISQTNGQTTSGVLATDDNRINQWKNNTQNDYSSQTAAINNTIATQKQNNSDYASALAAYQAAQQKYREKLASWKASHNISGNVVSTADVNQQLILGHEPNAQHQINYVAPQLKAISVSDAGTNFDAPAAGAYSTSQSINGEVFQITYTNLTNSSYTDSNGVKHRIAKIVFTYSDLSHNNLRENGLSTFVTYNDPAQGFWYNGSNGVTVNEQFYDEYGNPINIEPGTGYLAVTSLNAAYGNPATHEVTKTGEAIHVESATVLSGGSAVALLGSSIQVQGNTLVSPATNDYANDGKGNLSFGLKDGYVQGPQSTASAWQGDNWDGNSNEAYWGTGLINLSGNNVTVRFASDTKVNNEGTWATTQTIIPQTPGPTYDGPEKPNPKMTSVHYHYDTLNLRHPAAEEITSHYHYEKLNVASTPSKHWKAGDQTVDNKTSINDDIVNARIDMQVPNSTDVENGIKSVSLTDDYSQMSQYATYQSAQVMLNGQDVSSQYTITNNVQNHTVTAVAKDPSSTKAGTLSLLVNFKVNDSTPKGTQLPNSGTGEINGSTVGAGKVQLVTFTPNPVKHWVENNVTVDGKTYIDNDLVHAQVTMNLPTQAQLAKKLTNVQLIDDYSNFANKVTAQSVTVTENGKDVTSLYTITDQNGHITATRKDAASTPDGTAQLNITWKINSDVASGTRLHNSGFGVINNDSVKTNEVDIVTFIPTTSKHWVEGSQTVDGKVYVDGDTANAQVSMTLPDPNTLAKKLTNVSITDDYSQLAQYASLVPGSVKVLENGSDVTSSYTITTDNNKIVATRKDPASTPAGSVVLKSQYKIFETTPTGTKLVNSGSGTINSETVPTNTPSVVTYRPAPDKHWTEGSQTVDGKVYVDGDEVHTDVTMGLPDPNTLAKKLTNVTISDNYSDFADKVDYESATVLENGTDVTDQYNITNANGIVTAVRKDASSAPAGSVDLHLNFKIHDDVASGTLLNNTGSGQINNVTVTTPTRTISTFKQATDKNWIEGSQKVNGKIYINDDVAHSQITTTLPDPSTLAKKLSSVVITDDYSNFSKYADVQNVKILENNIDATSEYNIVTNASNGTIVATRKDPSTTPGGTATMQVAFKLHNDIPSGTQLVNKGNVKINSETVPTPTPSVTTYQPTTDKHWVNGTQTVDGKTFIDGDDVTGEVTMSLPEPKQLAKSLSNVSITDDYSRFADKVDYKSAKVFENGKDVTSDYTITNVNGKVTAVRKDPTSTPAGSVKLQVIWTVHTDVASGTQLVNGGSGTINSDTVPTPNRTIVTYKQNTDKHWINSQGQTVDGKVSIDGDTVTARINMTLPKRSDMGGQFNKIQLIDDFSKFADKVDLKDIHVYENGKDMTDQYNITVENNHVIATRKDPNSIDNSGNSATTATVALTGNAKGNLNNADAQSLVAASNASVNFKNGVTNSDKQDQATNDGGIVSLVVSYQIKDNVPSGTKLENYGAGIINNEVVATNHPVITTWKPKAIKDVIISVDNQKSLNNSNIDLNHEFDYKLVGDALPQNLSDPLTQYGFKDDYDQSHDQYNGQYSVLLDEDVILKDGTLLKKGTDVRKYTTQAIDVQNGDVDIEFDKDFLNKIDFEKGGFGASAYLDMKRIKAGDVYNKYSNIINGKEYVSNTVKTHTEEPKKPTPAPTPKPAATKTEITTPVQPVMAASMPQEATQIATPKVETQDQQQSNQSLPQTGNDTNKDALIGAIALGVIGMSMIPMKKRTEEF